MKGLACDDCQEIALTRPGELTFVVFWMLWLDVEEDNVTADGLMWFDGD